MLRNCLFPPMTYLSLNFTAPSSVDLNFGDERPGSIFASCGKSSFSITLKITLCTIFRISLILATGIPVEEALGSPLDITFVKKIKSPSGAF